VQPGPRCRAAAWPRQCSPRCLPVIASEPSGFFGGKSKLKIRGLDEQGGLLDYLELDR
jgi:hypothetical protein